MKPLTLAPVDRRAQMSASAIAQHLRTPDLREKAATAWARALEISVTVRDGGVDAATISSGASVCHATAGLLLPGGRQARLSVSTQLLAGLMAALAGATPKAIGPTPLSPAEEGLFAFLVLRWTALWPDPPVLDWIDGGAGLIDAPAGVGAVVWHVSVADQRGIARWSLPQILPAPKVAATRRPDLPVIASLSAGGARWGGRRSVGAQTVGALAAGDLLVLTTPGMLQVGDRSWPVQRHADRWQVAAMKEVHMPDALDALPIVLDAVVGRITLTVGDVAGLAPGVVLPLADDATPIVTLVAGGQPIARGILVDDDGAAAVQITQVLAPPA